jgi:cobalamin biosynthesis protein CbiG
MKIAIIAFTEKGCELAKKIASALANNTCTVYAPERLAVSLKLSISGSLDEWTAERFADSEALVFISAAGIAVRAVAPYIKDKFTDPAVLSADEKGRYVISLLSGHVGGANELAQRIAALISALPVISTANRY